MKNKKSLIIQSLIALALIGSWGIYQLSQDDKWNYSQVLRQAKVGHSTTRIISYSSNRLINSAERITERNPKQKVIVDAMKETQVLIQSFKELISDTRTPIVQFDESKLDAAIKAGEPFLPIDYNSKTPVRKVLGDEEIQDDFVKKSQLLLKELKSLMAQDLRANRVSEDILSDEKLKLYYERMDTIFKNNTSTLTQIAEENRLEEVAQYYDVCHSESFFVALKYEVACLEWLLLNNMLSIMSESRSPLKPIIVMANDRFGMEEKSIRVGEPTELTFFRTHYVASDSLKIKLNDKPLEVKGGIATFDYRPQSTGMKYFKVDIALKNPFTGKMENFSKTQKIEVID